MKTKNTIALFLLMAAAACSSIHEESVNTERAKSAADEVFYAMLEQSGSTDATKVYADENLKVLWNADDRITIYNKYTYGYQYAFQGITGDSAGAFLKKEDDAEFVTGNPLEHIYAVYPYQEDNKINNSGDLSITWPSSQTYKAESFGIGANVMVSVTDNNQLRFRNVGGYLALKLYGDNVSVSSITLRGNNGEKLSGRAKVTCAADDDPTLTFLSASSESIRLECPTPVPIGTSAESATTFWMVVPPTEFTQGFNVTIRTSNGLVFVKSTDIAYEIERNTLCRMAAIEVIPSDIVPFADANFKAYCVTNFDTDSDGEISLSEALAVTTIEVCTDNIESLQGVEFFKNLEILGCNGTWDDDSQRFIGILSSLDVSNNTALKELACESNQLTALDVSNNTALRHLYCGDNQLTTINVSNNTALTQLYCHSNQLTTLDISHNTALTSLYCDNNQLTALDVSNNSALTWLWCNDNQLTSLDVSGCTMLGRLCCYNNHLTSLDVSNNSALTYLRCDSNPYLTEIWLIAGQTVQLKYDSSIARINYIGLSDIILFEDANFKAYCVANFDTNKDGEVSVAEAFPVTKISVNTDNIYSLGGIEYFTNLETLYARGSMAVFLHTSLTAVSCIDGYDVSVLPDPDIGSSVASGKLSGVNLSSLQKLRSVDISNNNSITSFNPESCSTLNYIGCAFCNISEINVSNNSALTGLNCSYNQLTDLDVTNNSALTSLDCGCNQLTDLDVTNNSALTSLNCGCNQLTDLDVTNNTALTSLYCDYNQLTDLDVTNNSALTSLGCGDNHLTDLNVTNNSALTSLGCGSNHLTALDITNNIALTYLYCSSNPLESLDVTNNTGLTHLYCGSNQLTSLDVSIFTALEQLSCCGNQLSSLDVSHNTALTYLRCDGNQLTSLDVSNNAALSSLDCRGNQLTSIDVSNNTTLTCLLCEYNFELTEIWLKRGQSIDTFDYDSTIAQIYYKD